MPKLKILILFLCLLLSQGVLIAQKQTGKATFYSKKATGARTASGEKLHHDSLTCAHRTYPFGSLLKVINVSNGKEVVVRVTDRGPFGKGKIIDLSWGAARALDFLSQGVTSVIVEPIFLNNVPYRMNERIELPEMSFDMTQTDYSFIAEWKKEVKKKLKQPREATKVKEVKPKKTTNKSSSSTEPQTNQWSEVFKKIGL